MKNNKFKHIIKNYLIGWFIAEILYEILRKTDLRNEDLNLMYQSVVFFLSWFFQGVLFGILHYYIDIRYRKKISFGSLLILTLIAQVFFFVLVILLILPFVQLMGYQKSFSEVLLMPYVRVALIYAFFINFGISLMLQVNLILGKGVLMAIIKGKFYKPFHDSRIFMFLDLKDSTVYAEKLGHLKFSQLIQDCFYDLSVVENYEAEVHKYVGDEVILVWNVQDGVKNMNCIRAFYSFEDVLVRKSEYYQKEYGFIPEFKAGVYMGEVTIAEVGELKREIAYLGDTVNTTARIEGMCNKFNAKLLLSGELINLLDMNDEFETEFKGNVNLRGKEKEIDLYSVKKKLK